MAQLGRHLSRSVAVSVGALVVSTFPAVLDGAQAVSATPAVVFYTPLVNQAVRVAAPSVPVADRTPVHIALGTADDVTSVHLSYTKVGGGSGTIGDATPDTASHLIYFSWPTTLTGTIDLQATGYGADGQVGDPVSETVTLSTNPSTQFDFVRPHIRRDTDGNVTGVEKLGVFRRADGRAFAKISGTTTATTEPTVDAPTPMAPSTTTASLPNPTGEFVPGNGTGIFREPLDLTGNPGLTSGRAVVRAVVQAADGSTADAVVAPLYTQTVTAVRSTSTTLANGNITITTRVTDQYGQPVVGAPVRLAGYASGSRTANWQIGVTDAVDGLVTFSGPGAGTGPASATGYPGGFYTAYVDLNLDGKQGSKEPAFESVWGTVSYAAPGKSLYHSDVRIPGSGGVLADSLRGTRIAAARHYQWIDQDGQLAYSTVAGLRGGAARVSQPGHLTWVNAHGAPFNPRWLKKGRFETRAWSNIKRRRGLRNAEMTFQQNAAYGLNVEWEVKNIRPFTSTAALDAAFANLATAAQRYYGAAWTSRVQVKMLSDLPGGQAFALRVLRVARAHGFTTILLARGGATGLQIPTSAHAYVTYVRGARAGLYAPIPSASQNTPVKTPDLPLDTTLPVNAGATVLSPIPG